MCKKKKQKISKAISQFENTKNENILKAKKKAKKKANTTKLLAYQTNQTGIILLCIKLWFFIESFMWKIRCYTSDQGILSAITPI